jgi:hypothetical protein
LEEDEDGEWVNERVEIINKAAQRQIHKETEAQDKILKE